MELSNEFKRRLNTIAENYVALDDVYTTKEKIEKSTDFSYLGDGWGRCVFDPPDREDIVVKFAYRRYEKANGFQQNATEWNYWRLFCENYNQEVQDCFVPVVEIPDDNSWLVMERCDPVGGEEVSDEVSLDEDLSDVEEAQTNDRSGVPYYDHIGLMCVLSDHGITLTEAGIEETGYHREKLKFYDYGRKIDLN